MRRRRWYYFYRLKRNLWLKPGQLQEMQRRRLIAIVRFAYENVPFYHRKLDSVNVKPDDIKSVDDLSKIPTTTKSEIQSSQLADVMARNHDVDECLKATTSGSTGLPLTVFHDREAMDFRWALQARGYWEQGLRPWHKLAVIDDPRVRGGYSGPANAYRRKSLSQRLRISRKNYISIFDDANTQLAILEDVKPDVIDSFSSSMTILAQLCAEKGCHIRPHVILTSSDLLYENDAKLIRSTFGCDTADNYGCYELGQLSWECREHMGYHMNTDAFVIEFVKDDERAAFGERGEIVCTGLINYAMPLIRYRMDDEGSCVNEECSCGRPLPLMKILEGRRDDFLTALDGRIVSPLIFFPYPFSSLEGIKQFKVIQETRDKLTIQLVGAESLLTKGLFENAKKDIKRVFGDGMQVEFQLVEKIDRDPSGKLRKIISKIPIDARA
jgi:phenylacetate-CoA ligase